MLACLALILHSSCLTRSDIDLTKSSDEEEQILNSAVEVKKISEEEEELMGKIASERLGPPARQAPTNKSGKNVIDVEDLARSPQDCKPQHPSPASSCAHCSSTVHVSTNSYCSVTSHYADCLAAATFCADCHDLIEEGPSPNTPAGSALDIYCPMCRGATCHICNMGDKFMTDDGDVLCEDCFRITVNF